MENPTQLIPTGSEALSVSGQFDGGDGQPHQMFVRDVIRKGSFVHPSSGQQIDVDQNRLQHWADQFRKYSDAGHKVRVPMHSHRGENGGWVRDAWVEGDRLKVKLEAIGDDAIKATARNMVSVGILPDFKDAEGREFSDFIEHVAVVPNPVVNKLEDPEAVAASVGGGYIDSALTGATMPHKRGEKTMKNIIQLCNEKLGTKLSEDADEKTIAETLGPKLDELAKGDPVKPVAEHLGVQFSADSAGDEIVKAIKQRDEKVQQLEAEINKNKPVELSREVKVLSQRQLETELSTLVNEGRITPAVSDALKPMLATDTMLSVGDSDQPNYAPIIEALKKNEPAELGEKTPAQNMMTMSFDQLQNQKDNQYRDPDFDKRKESVKSMAG